MSPWMRALIGSRRVLKTQTFTGNATWVAPAGVTNLPSVSGKGQDGTASTTRTSLVVSIVYHASGTAGVGNIQWDSAQGAAEAVANDINTSGEASFTRSIVDVYPDETNSPAYTDITIHGDSATTVFSSGWRTSGHIATSGTASVRYAGVGTAGANTTAFSKTFPGGPIATPATVTTFDNVAVTPLASYSIVVPVGGSLTISYYQ